MSIIAHIKNLTTGQITKVVRRTSLIDDVLNRAGYEVSEINKIVTPLIGANRCTRMKILIPSNGLGGFMNAPFSQPKEEGQLDQTDFYSFVLYEPQGGGGTPVDRGSGSREQTAGGATREAGAGKGDGGGTGTAQSLMADAPQQTETLLQLPPNLGRYLKWNNLICVSIQELIISAGATKQKITYRPPIGTTALEQPAIYVMELVDVRYFLQSQMLCDLDNSTNPKYGTSIDQWNMLAENPLHLQLNTVKETVITEPNVEASYILDAGMDILPEDLIGVLQTNTYYEETPFTPKEIIASIIAKFKAAKMWGDKEGILFEDKKVSDEYFPKSVFDCINLDLRARCVGESLDEIASRIGCVWAWDRTTATLKLREADPAKDKPILEEWNKKNEMYRAAGGLNSLSIDMPESVVTIHPLIMASTYGLFPEEVIQDVRVYPARNGVEDFFPTTPLYYVNEYPRTSKKNNRTAFIGDHLPAFLGLVSGVVTDWSINTPAIDPLVLDIKPWNYEENTQSIWGYKSWSETLQSRNKVLSDRYYRLSDLVSGNLILSRIPCASDGKTMSDTPSVGLQYEEISFGFETKQQVQYRIYGSKKDTLLLPSLISQPRVSTLGLSRCRNVLGTLNIEYLKPRAGIVRTFVCSFSAQKELKIDEASGEATMWLYRFTEMQLSNIAFPKWQAGDETNSLSGKSGYALNLCELTPANTASPPTVNFDGGTLFYPPAGQNTATTSVMMTPAAGGQTGLTMCYEIINEGGATTYWIAVSNGVKVQCSSVPLTGINGKWQNIGVSGVAFPSSVPLVDRII